jgi:hypothetical protein
MKILIKLAILLVIIAVAAPYIMKDKNGNALMSLDFDSAMNHITQMFSDKNDPNTASSDLFTPKKETTEVFKWKDKHGNWQFSDKPVAGHETSVHKISKTNRSDAIKLPDKEEESKTASTISADGSFPLPLNVQNVPKLIEDAENVQALLDNRQKQMDELLGAPKK